MDKSGYMGIKSTDSSQEQTLHREVSKTLSYVMTGFKSIPGDTEMHLLAVFTSGSFFVFVAVTE